MNVTHKISADLQIRAEVPRLTMVQGDLCSRQIEITLTSGGTAWIPESADTILLRYRKSDGTGGSYDTLPDGNRAWSMEQNRVTVWAAPQMLTVPGLVEAQVLLMSGNHSISTFAFQIFVEEDPSVGTAESEDYINWSEWTKQQLEVLLEQAKQSGDFDGSCFVPSVDADGMLSWSKDAGIGDPEPVNIADLIAGKINGSLLQGDVFGNINMNGYRISALAEPADPGDAATKGYVLALTKQHSPRNLLDNSNFENPVNQRGTSSYTGNYGIDRWLLNTTGSMALDSGGILLRGLSAAAHVCQYLPLTGFSGKIYTGSVTLADGTSCIFGGAAVPDPAGITETVFVGQTAELADGVQVGLCVFPSGYLGVQISVSAGKSIKLRNIALYEGSYTAETIPAYQGKDFSAELAECQRYFYRIKAYWKWVANGICTNSTTAMLSFRLPQAMRINPTVTIPDVNLIKVRCGTTASQVPSEIRWNNSNELFDIIQMTATVTGAASGTTASLYFDNGGIIDFSAEL